MDDLFNNPGFYVSYAVIQAIVVLLLIRLLDFYDRQPLGLLAVMAGWGATGAALIALAGNRTVRAMLSDDARDVFGNAIAPPLVEEGAKGLALIAAVGPIRWLGRRFGMSIFEGVTAGMVYGAAVGLGFAFTEDVFYFVNEAQSQGLQNGLDVFVHRRDFFGPAMLHHPLWTAAFGAGLGAAAWTASRWKKVLFPLLGFMAAVLMHAINNGLVEFVLWLRYGMARTAAWARGEILDPVVEDTASTLVTLTNLLDFYVLAMFVVAVVLWLRYQRRIIAEQLADEAETAPPGDLWQMLRSGQLERWRHRRRLQRVLVQLALLKWRTERFGGDRERIQRLRREIATLATYDVGAGNIPEPATPLLGRESELESLEELFNRPEVRLVTLTGPGGTGKTRLAIEVARGSRDRFPSGAFFVSLAPVRDPGLVASAIAEVLGVQLGEGDAGLTPLKDYLRDKRLLLVLDNLEQLEGAGSVIAELVAAAPRLHVLATSRDVLAVPSEHEFRVGSLLGPSALRLFEERAQAVDPDFRLTDDNRATLEELCRRLDGLPLAIELTAARVRLLSPQELLARLDQPSGATPLDETISWSYDLLDADEQTLLARMSVFVGGCNVRAAEFVCGDGVLDVVGGLESLVEKSLARRSRGSTGEARVEMLETIRAFATARLQESGDAGRVRQRFSEYCVALAERAEPHLTSPEQPLWLARLSEENPNLRAALAWSAEQRQLEPGLRIAGALVRFWSARGLMAEGRSWLATALGQDGVPPRVRAKGLFAAGYAALGLGEFADARRQFEECLALASELDDRQLHGAALAQLAWVAMADGRRDEARALADASLRLARPAGDRITASGALNVLGELAWRDGNGQAKALFEEGLALRRELGDDRLVANSLLLLGRADQDEERFEEALELARAVGDSWSTSVALVNLGRVRRDPALLEEALQIARDRGDKRLSAEALQALAATELRDGDAARAARLRGAAQALLDEVGAELTPPELALDDELLPGLDDALGKEAAEREWAAGREEDAALDSERV